MPTGPLKGILDLDWVEDARKREPVRSASLLLREVLNYASNVFGRCDHSSGTGDGPILLLYLHMIQMIDGVEVLLSQCCVDAAIPLLRSSFECLLAMDYILEDPDQYERR